MSPLEGLPQPSQALTTKDLNKTPKEIAAAGMHVVISGDVYYATYQMIEKLIDARATDANTHEFLKDLRRAMVEQAVPVKSRIKGPAS